MRWQTKVETQLCELEQRATESFEQHLSALLSRVQALEACEQQARGMASQNDVLLRSSDAFSGLSARLDDIWK